MDNKPNIVEVISDYLPLKRSGKEWSACCPFHEDKTPSFFINEESGVFYCFGCHVTGDVFDFLMKWSDKPFKEVASFLGVKQEVRRRIVPDSTEIAAKNIYDWLRDFAERVAFRLRELGFQIELAKAWPAMMPELEALEREWTILETLHQDLFNPDYVLELYGSRENLERLIGE